MTVLLAVNDFPPILGGEATLYHGLAARLPAHTALVLAPRGPGQAEIDNRIGTEVIRHALPAPRGQSGRMMRGFLVGIAMLRLVLTRRVRYLVCGQLLSIGVPGRIVARLARIPYALVIHGADLTDYHDRFPWGRLIRWTVRGADVIFVNSRFTAALVERLLPGVPRRIEVLPMGTEAARAVEPRVLESWRRRYGIGEGPVLITVARLVGVKGHDILMEALDRLRHRVPGIVWIVVGEGPERARLESRVRDLGMSPHVVFAGSVANADLPAHYHLGTIFVQISQDMGGRQGVEGFGLSFLEAAAYGLPVIAGRTGGTPEAVADGCTGILVPPDDPAAVATAIERLLTDRDARNRMAKAARQWASEHSWEGAARAILDAAGQAPNSRTAGAAMRRS